MQLMAAPQILSCPGPRTIREAAQTHSLLLEAVQSQADLVLDCSAVDQTDLSFVQIILAARQTAAAIGHRLRLQAPLPLALLDVLRRGGFQPADIADWTSAGEPA